SRAEGSVIDVARVVPAGSDPAEHRLRLRPPRAPGLAQQLATVLDRELVPRLGDLVGIAGELRRIGMRIAARKTAADIDGIDKNAGRHYKLADLPQRIAGGRRNDRLRSDMEGNTEPAGRPSLTQQQEQSIR